MKKTIKTKTNAKTTNPRIARRRQTWIALAVSTAALVVAACAPIMNATSGISACTDALTPCAFDIRGGTSGITYKWSVKALGQSGFQIKICDTPTSGCDDATRTVYNFVCDGQNQCVDQNSAPLITVTRTIENGINRLTAVDPRYNVAGDGAFFVRAQTGTQPYVQSGNWVLGTARD